MNPLLILAVLFVVIMLAKAIVRIPENHRGAVERLGRYEKALTPGVHFIIPTFDVVKMIDLDAAIRGWQGMSEAQLAQAIKDLVTYGTMTPSKGLGNKPFFAVGSTFGPREAQALSTWLVKTAGEQMGMDLSQDPTARSRLIESAQKAVEVLASDSSYEIHLPFLGADRSGPKHFSLTLTTSQLTEIVAAGRG